MKISIVSLLLRISLPTLISLVACWVVEVRFQDPAEQKVKLENSSTNGLLDYKFSRNKAMVAGSGDEIMVWDTNTGKLKMSVRNGVYHGPDVDLSANGKLVSGRSKRLGILIWDTETGKQVRALRTSENETRLIIAVRFSPDGKILATGNSDDTISLWDIATGSETLLKQNMSYAGTIEFSQDGKLLASGGRDGTVRIWDVAKKTEAACLKGFQGNRVHNVVFGGGDKLLASYDIVEKDRNADPSGAGVLSRIQDGEEIARFPNTRISALTEDGHYLCALSDDDHVLSIWSIVNRTRVFQYKAKEKSSFRAVKFISNDKLICLMADGKELTILRINTGLGQK